MSARQTASWHADLFQSPRGRRIARANPYVDLEIAIAVIVVVALVMGIFVLVKYLIEY